MINWTIITKKYISPTTDNYYTQLTGRKITLKKLTSLLFTFLS